MAFSGSNSAREVADRASGLRRAAKPWNWPPPRGHVLLDSFTGGLLLVLVMLTPWLFGTTEWWAENIANGIAYVLGALLGAKVLYRRVTGYVPIRWRLGTNAAAGNGDVMHPADRLTRALVWITGALLVFAFVSALNARAIYLWNEERFVYLDSIAWLPRSYDAPASWQMFRNLLGWACAFWAARDWLLNCTETESSPNGAADHSSRRFNPPRRLRLLLWVLAVNGALLAAEGLVQRLDGTSKVLWLREPTYNREATSQFGPFPYRANGAQYLNLVWPLTLGFWWLLHRRPDRKSFDTRHHLLLPCALLTIVGPLMSLSRGGALIALVLLAGVGGTLLLAQRRGNFWVTSGALVLGLAGAALGAAFAWHQFSSRMEALPEGFKNRWELTRNGWRIVQDFWLFGTGPGTFQPVFQLYRQSLKDYAPGQLHNDWLETWITFGSAGLGLILAALALTGLRWFRGTGGIPAPGIVAWLFAAPLIGALVHGWFDLPFQVYSITLLFVIECAVLFCLVRRRPEA